MKSSPYHESLVKLGIINRIYCSTDETTAFNMLSDDELPEDVFWGYDGEDAIYICWRYSKLPDNEAVARILVNVALSLKTIKGYLLFFVILTVISLAFSILAIIL